MQALVTAVSSHFHAPEEEGAIAHARHKVQANTGSCKCRLLLLNVSPTVFVDHCCTVHRCPPALECHTSSLGAVLVNAGQMTHAPSVWVATQTISPGFAQCSQMLCSLPEQLTKVHLVFTSFWIWQWGTQQCVLCKHAHPQLAHDLPW